MGWPDGVNFSPSNPAKYAKASEEIQPSDRRQAVPDCGVKGSRKKLNIYTIIAIPESLAFVFAFGQA